MKIGDKLYKYVDEPPVAGETEEERIAREERNRAGHRKYRYDYAEMAIWCNSNNATIEDKGEYVEIVEIPAPTERELLQQELNTLLAWFEKYDEKCMQYQRSLRLGTQWEEDITVWDSQAVVNATRIKEIRQILG